VVRLDPRLRHESSSKKVHSGHAADTRPLHFGSCHAEHQRSLRRAKRPALQSVKVGLGQASVDELKAATATLSIA
jgi:hypothetical protein